MPPQENIDENNLDALNDEASNYLTDSDIDDPKYQPNALHHSSSLRNQAQSIPPNINRQIQDMQKLNDKIRHMKTFQEANDKNIRDLQSENNVLKTEIIKLKETLSAKEALINEFQFYVEKSNDKFKQFEEKNELLLQEKQDLINKLSEYESEIKVNKNLNEELSSHERNIVMLKEHISEMENQLIQKESLLTKKFSEREDEIKNELLNEINKLTKRKNEIDNEIKILITTDVLAEGLNLQDASCLINYELHWNPVRLMQRIGRVDRRRNAAVEERLLRDHPELAADRDNAYYWNFLPPEELEKLLSLYATVSKKTLRISKTFGIEGKKLLTPDDDYDALKDFNSQYEGETSTEEEMSLAYQELMKKHPNYEEMLSELPRKMYSGKRSTGSKGFFFCYELPTKLANGEWSNGNGLYRWYFLDIDNETISERTYDIWRLIRCHEDEPRAITVTEDFFAQARKKAENYIKKSYMRSVQAPIGIKPRLVTWLELC
jgi:superfamily II DNA/RNA helicase